MDDSAPREESMNGMGCDLRLLRRCEAIWKGVKRCDLDGLDGARTAMHGPHVRHDQRHTKECGKRGMRYGWGRTAKWVGGGNVYNNSSGPEGRYRRQERLVEDACQKRKNTGSRRESM